MTNPIGTYPHKTAARQALSVAGYKKARRNSFDVEWGVKGRDFYKLNNRKLEIVDLRDGQCEVRDV